MIIKITYINNFVSNKINWWIVNSISYIFVTSQNVPEAYIYETPLPESWQENQKIWKSVTPLWKSVGLLWLMDRSRQKSFKDDREMITDQEDRCGLIVCI